MRKNTYFGLAFAAALSLPLAACKDTKTLQENAQLKAQVEELQKENGQLGNDLETMTAARNTLAQENGALKAQGKSHTRAQKSKRSATKPGSRKHRRR